MQTEKMMILKMLEEGKINAEEASRLLAADGSPKPRPAPTPSSGHIPNSQIPPSSSGSSAPGSSVDTMTAKFGAFMKDMEPKLQKAGKFVVEKTAGAADYVSKSLASRTPHDAPKPSYQTSPAPPPHPPSPRNGIEEVVEIKVAQGGAELNLTGLNGNVLIKGYNGDKISAKIFTVAKRAGAKARLDALGNKYYLSFDENDFERVCIDAFVPEAMFDNIKAATNNGDLSVSTVTTHFLHAENINGNSEIDGVSAHNLTVEASNGRLDVKNSSAQVAHIENFNGPVNISKIDIADMKASTFNGSMDLQVAAFNNHDNYRWHAETSNGKMNVLLPTYATLGYHIKAHAALDAVKLGLVSMNYIRNDKSFVEAQSGNFDSCMKKVVMELSTSNAPLIVN